MHKLLPKNLHNLIPTTTNRHSENHKQIMQSMRLAASICAHG